ncbi:hypothetical protein LTR94_030193, partial [Friedmanniomyces endolithicus]
EARLVDHKWYAALDYIRANRLNRVVVDAPRARFGIVAAGKAYLDLRQALVDLGIDDDACARIGIRILKEYLDFGLHAWAMSRYTGLWVSMKCVTDIIESGAVVDLDPDRVQIVTPTDFQLPPDGLNIRWPDAVLDQEVRMSNHKWYAALAYARANKLNRIIWDSPRPKIGIITAGKSYLDTRQALADLGIDEQAA